MREGASNNTYTKGETMEDGYRTLVTESEKASALNRTYATVSKQVHDKQANRAAKARLKAPA